MMVNFPSSPSPCVGRQDELAQLDALVSDPACRLLTLVGPGGIGKTRLAIEAARQLPNPEHVYFVALQPLMSPDFLVTTLGEALGLRFYGGSKPKQQLLDYLREKTLLLVLDNFEHLLDGVPLLSEMLDYAPNVRLLVTSRERLNLVEEWVFEVSGLSYPADERMGDAEQYGAVELFVQHARRVKTSFRLTEAQRPALARICRLVGGMPLAIELAAAWVRALSCEAIADEIAHSLDILETPARNVEPRHRTMRAAFEPTWAYLSDSERNMFMRLSVFRGGFTREAAEAVAGASLRALTGLVDKSLLRVDANGRYDLHELLRQYAVEKLLDADQVDAAQRHLDYFMKLAEQAEAHVYGREQSLWFHRLEVELDNLRAALAWAFQDEEGALGLRITSALRWFWEYRGHLGEGLAWTERFRVFAVDVPPSLWAKALHRAGELAGMLGDERAVTLCTEALTLARQINNPWNIAWSLSALAFTGYGADLDENASLREESVRLFREMEDPLGLSHALRRRAWTATDQGNYPYARALLDEALLGARQVGDKNAIAWVLFLLGEVSWHQKYDFGHITALFEESMALFRELGDRLAAVYPLVFLAGVEHVAGNESLAQTLYQEALTLLRDLGSYDYTNLTPSPVVLGHSIATFDDLLDLFRNRIGSLAAVVGVEGNPRIHSTVYATMARFLPVEMKSTMQVGDTDAAQPPPSDSPTHADPLTKRELEIMHLIAEGLTNGEIADQLVLAKGTVKWYIHQIFSKLHATTRTQVVARARSLGLLT